MSGYHLTETALRDLDNILAHLVDQASADIAYRLRKELFTGFDMLAQFPGIGHRRTDLTRSAFVFWTLDPCLIVYQRDPSPITIHAVLHGARDVRRVLRSRKPRQSA